MVFENKSVDKVFCEKYLKERVKKATFVTVLHVVRGFLVCVVVNDGGK